MTQIDKFKTRVEKIQRLADTLDRHKTDFIEAVAYDAGFPVKITYVVRAMIGLSVMERLSAVKSWQHK